jgi:hypothetical protein
MSAKGDFDAVRQDIRTILSKPGYDDGNAGPVFVRLAWYFVYDSVYDSKPSSNVFQGTLLAHTMFEQTPEARMERE